MHRRDTGGQERGWRGGSGDQLEGWLVEEKAIFTGANENYNYTKLRGHYAVQLTPL